MLTEGDDTNDPIADAARGILDGHIVLSRQLADMGQYPAIDLESSVSRVMPMVTSDAQQQSSQQIKQLYSVYEQNKDLINVGAYQPGTNPQIDRAIAMHPYIQRFMQQSMNEAVSFQQSQQMLTELLARAEMNDV